MAGTKEDGEETSEGAMHASPKVGTTSTTSQTTIHMKLFFNLSPLLYGFFLVL